GEVALVSGVVAAAIPDNAKVVDTDVNAIKAGGRIFYLGAGTSGRVAVLDAVECPASFGSPPDWLQAVMAGGTRPCTQAVEGSEDNQEKAESDLKSKRLTRNDVVIGITASGTTPYAVAGLNFAKAKGAKTVAIVC